MQIRGALAGADVLVTVAFDDPEGLEMHASLVRHYVGHDVHIIADNSTSEDSAARNQAIAEAHGALYVRLPFNPWTARNDSRSHGLALNWIWRNILRPGAPRAFGLLDDDLFPVAPTNPFDPLDINAFYGDVRTAGARWFLWAGFCFFRFHAVRNERLDFGLDWFNGLDTGGANWEVLYRHADPAVLPPRPIERFAALSDHPESAAYFERRGAWIHEVGWPRNPDLLQAKREALIVLLTPHLEKASGRPGQHQATDRGAS